MSIKKVMMMFALLTGIACVSYAQGVSNDSTATTKEDGLKLTKEAYPQAEEDGDLYHGLTKTLMFDRMTRPSTSCFRRRCATWTWVRPT